MNIALLPTLTEANKTALKRWLQATLANPRLVNINTNYPLNNNEVAIYVDGHARFCYYGSWQDDGARIRIGQESTLLGVAERLGVMGALISVAGLWTELTDAYTAAVSRSLLESYNTAMQGLVRLQGGGPATGLAFSADRAQVAALVGDGWVLPTGAPAAVDETWTIVQ